MSKDFFLCLFFIGEDRDESDDDTEPESLLESFRRLLLLSLDSNSKVFSWAFRSCVFFTSSLSEESSFDEDDEELEDEEDLLFRPRVLVILTVLVLLVVLSISISSFWKYLFALIDWRFQSCFKSYFSEAFFQRKLPYLSSSKVNGLACTRNLGIRTSFVSLINYYISPE